MRFPRLHASLFCPNLTVKKEGVERRGGGGREERETLFVEHRSSAPLWTSFLISCMMSVQ